MLEVLPSLAHFIDEAARRIARLDGSCDDELEPAL
jgi:hypothetical protein